MGGMYGGMGGMYGGMGMMPGQSSSYAESMFRMTEMLEMNSHMLDQLQEHVSMTYNRLRDIVVWIFALKDIFFKRASPEVLQEQYYFATEDAKNEALARLRKR